MSQDRVEGTCWLTEHAQLMVTASQIYKKVAAPPEPVQMVAALRKGTREAVTPVKTPEKGDASHRVRPRQWLPQRN